MLKTPCLPLVTSALLCAIFIFLSINSLKYLQSKERLWTLNRNRKSIKFPQISLRFSSKTLVCLFFKTTGVVLLSYLERGKTITHESYINDCLDPLIKEINKLRPTDGIKNIKLHHDNARPHVHQAVKSYLKEKKLDVMDHPSYSPDLAPCDFWLFDYIKQRLDNHSNQESLMDQIVKIVQNIDHSEYIKTFEMWLERMKLCIKNNGDYFEHI